MIHNWLDIIKKLFLNGLIALLPIIITFTIFSFFFKLLKSILEPISHIDIPFITVPHSEILIVFIFIVFAGLFLKSIVIRSFIELFEIILDKMPLVRTVYKSIKQFVHAFSPSDTSTFKQVVLVEFPRKGIYSIGFLTGKLHPNIAPMNDTNYYNIFISHTPNPTSGSLIVAKEEDFIIIDITTQEAMSLIISGGIIQPERF